MPQEIRVVRCCDCETFQSDIVKKVPKWSCKICNTKQSLLKTYFTGSGKECRQITQQLNSKKADNENTRTLITSTVVSNEENVDDSGYLQLAIEQNKNQLSAETSKWEVYLPQETKPEDETNIEVLLGLSQTTNEGITSKVGIVSQSDCVDLLFVESKQPTKTSDIDENCDYFEGIPDKKLKHDSFDVTNVQDSSINIFEDANDDLSYLLDI